MLRCTDELAELLLSRTSSCTQRVLRLRAHRIGHARLNDVAADQLVGGLLMSAAELLRSDSTETLTFYLEAGLEGLHGVGEELDAFVGSMAAFFVGRGRGFSRNGTGDTRGDDRSDAVVKMDGPNGRPLATHTFAPGFTAQLTYAFRMICRLSTTVTRGARSRVVVANHPRLR